MTQWLPWLVARLPVCVSAKLLVAFLVIAGLLITVSAVGLGVLGETNRRAEELIILHHKIAAYRQLQHDTTGQHSSVTATLALLLEQVSTPAASRRRSASSSSLATTSTGCTTWPRTRPRC
jgi:hypothetical protein